MKIKTARFVFFVDQDILDLTLILLFRGTVSALLVVAADRWDFGSVRTSIRLPCFCISSQRLQARRGWTTTTITTEEECAGDDGAVG